MGSGPGPGPSTLPELVLYGTAGVFATLGVFFLLGIDRAIPVSDLVLQVFAYVGLPSGVILGGLYVRRGDLPAWTWWYVTGGYLGGVAAMTVMVVWANLSEFASGGSLLPVVDTIVFMGNIGGAFGLVAGISGGQTVYNRQLRREVERRNQRLDEFAGLLAHDLQNPLTVAEGHLDLLEDTVENEHTAAIGDAHDRLGEIVEDTLELTRQGRRVEATTAVDVGDLARATWRHVSTADASLRVETDGHVQADETRLKRVFENLFRNSIEHGGEDVTVTVGRLPDGFYVEDDGRGLPDDRERLFAPGHTNAADGSGLGLSIVKAIVEAHGWEITVVTGSGGGARFEVRGAATDLGGP